MTGVRRRAAAALAALAVATSAGCSLVRGGGLETGSLPGGAGGDEVYRVTVVFADVLDLVPQAAVKVDDVNVGSVEAIDLDDFRAKVRLRIDEDVELPADVVATLRQTSLLGEKFVELAPPPDGGSGRLRDGDVVTIDRTGRNPEVEEVFSALAALLNGGGLTELQTIAVELTKVMAGREQHIRGALRRIDKLVTALDDRKSEIVRAIDALDKLAATLAAQRRVIGDALDAFTPALTVLADHRADLTRLLTRLGRLGDVGTRVIRESRDDTLADLRMLGPILGELVAVKTDVAAVVDQLVTFTALVPKDIPGDYLQLLVTLYFDPTTTPVDAPTGPRPGARRAGATSPPSGGAGSPAVPPLPGPAGLAGLLAGGVR